MGRHAVWSAPANALIAGEYAITRPGGKGIAVATQPRGRIRVSESTDTNTPFASIGTKGGIRVRAAMGRSTTVWPEEELPLIAAIVDTLRAEDLSVSAVWDIEIDTRDFFQRATGNKRGFGSSAVTALLFTTALRGIADRDRSDDDPDLRLLDPQSRASIALTAIRLHRAAHGGVGSGYDIATSALGGITEFIGGNIPTFGHRAAGTEWCDMAVSLYSWNTNAPVSSAKAVEQFNTRVPPGTPTETEWLQRINRSVGALSAAENWRELFSAIAEAADDSAAIGEFIGVSATLPIVGCHHDDGWVIKTSGAGNERGIIFAHSDHRRPLPEGVQQLEIDSDGLLCEEYAL
jgi:phosphomevalonate kinase